MLKNYILLTSEEFKILDTYSHPGKFWTLINYSNLPPYRISQRVNEYIIDYDTFLFYKIVSDNILAYWDTSITKHLLPGQEFHITETLIIRPYVNH